MPSKGIKWFSESTFRKNVEASRKMYEFLERDFEVCVEYVALDMHHLKVYSFRLANLILRIGPEILRLFNLLLFDPGYKKHLQPETEKKILNIQTKKEKRRDTFMDYLRIFPVLKKKCVTVKALEIDIIPFKTEKRKLPHGKEYRDVVFWWEDGYNALRHRVIREFEKSATLEHALYSLAGLWVLHDLLDRAWPRQEPSKSEFFFQPVDKNPCGSENIYPVKGLEDKH